MTVQNWFELFSLYNLVSTVLKDNFKKFVMNKIEKNDIGCVQKKREAITVAPEFVELFATSKTFSRITCFLSVLNSLNKKIYSTVKIKSKEKVLRNRER